MLLASSYVDNVCRSVKASVRIIEVFLKLFFCGLDQMDKFYPSGKTVINKISEILNERHAYYFIMLVLSSVEFSLKQLLVLQKRNHKCHFVAKSYISFPISKLHLFRYNYFVILNYIAYWDTSRVLLKPIIDCETKPIGHTQRT